MIKTYTLYLDRDGEEIKVDLRLNLMAQKQLENEYHENAVTTLFGSMDSPTKIANVFKHALNFKGNENVIKSGEELYDLIADNGLGGMSGFEKILSNIGLASGLLNEKEKETIDGQSEKIIDQGNQ